MSTVDDSLPCRLGGESLTVAQNSYAVLWAKGKELNLVFGLVLSLQVLGSAISINVNNHLYNKVFSTISSRHTRLGVVLIIGFGVCFITLVIALVLGCLDKRAESILKRKRSVSGQKIRCVDIKDFPITFWLLVIINAFCYAVFYNFNSISVLFFVQKYDYSISSAAFITSLLYYVAAVSLPISGYLLDKIGFNIFAGTTTALGTHLVLAFLGSSSCIPYLAVVIIGVSFSLVACAQWAIVSWVVLEHQVGTAFGIVQCAQNLALAVLTIVAGNVVDTNGYLVLEVSLCVQLSVLLIAATLLYLIDTTSPNGGQLNLSGWARKRQA